MSEYIEKYYLIGLYTDSDLDVFVTAEMLTEDEENEIKATKVV